MHLQKQGYFGDVPIISIYTRAQAIEDGVLVDVSESLECKQLGFKCSVALTRAVWDKYVEVPKGVTGQDQAGRLWDVAWMLRSAALSGARGTQILFSLHVRNDNREGTPPLVKLKAVYGPGDNMEPCITVMEPDED